MTPKADAVNKQRENHAQKIKNLESRVDEAIDEAIKEVDRLRVSVNVSDLPAAVIDAVREKYEAGGWQTDIKEGGDSRDLESWKKLVLY